MGIKDFLPWKANDKVDLNRTPKPSPQELADMTAEDFVLACGGVFTHDADTGQIFVEKEFTCANLGLERLPDLRAVVFEKNFDCSDNNLRTLDGAPRHVGGSFIICFNPVADFDGMPGHIGYKVNMDKDQADRFFDECIRYGVEPPEVDQVAAGERWWFIGADMKDFWRACAKSKADSEGESKRADARNILESAKSLRLNFRR